MTDKTDKTTFKSLAGKMLIANPYCSFGDIFDKCLIYVASNTETGSLGLIVNKYISKLGLKKLYQIDDQNKGEKFKNIYLGGPIDTERGFVLHNSEKYKTKLIFEEIGNLGVSSNIDIINDILNDKGPDNCLITLGYTGWGSGQLEKEIENNFWFIRDVDQDVLFSDDQKKWSTALKNAGIENNTLTSQMGHS